MAGASNVDRFTGGNDVDLGVLVGRCGGGCGSRLGGFGRPGNQTRGGQAEQDSGKTKGGMHDWGC